MSQLFSGKDILLAMPLASLKGGFYVFCFSPPVFIHRTQILAYIKKKPERREYLFGSGIYKK